MRFAAIHKLLRKQQLQGVGTVFNSQAEVDRAYEQTAEIMTRTIAHEAGHAIVGLALGAGDVLEWIAIYNVSGGTVGGGCKWGHRPCPIEEQWMSHTAGMAAICARRFAFRTAPGSTLATAPQRSNAGRSTAPPAESRNACADHRTGPRVPQDCTGNSASMHFRGGADHGNASERILGSLWHDIDWEHGTISVVRTLGRNDGQWRFAETKRARSRRVVKLQTWVLNLLKEVRYEALEGTQRSRGAPSLDLPPIFSPGIMRLSPGLGFRTWSL